MAPSRQLQPLSQTTPDGSSRAETRPPTPVTLSFHPGASNGEPATEERDRAWASEQGREEQAG